VKLSSAVEAKPYYGKANTVKWALEKLVADLDAEMDKMYKAGARDLSVDLSIGSGNSIQAMLRGEA
jgi:hypothetical protein